MNDCPNCEAARNELKNLLRIKCDADKRHMEFLKAIQNVIEQFYPDPTKEEKERVYSEYVIEEAAKINKEIEFLKGNHKKGSISFLD